MYKLLFLPPAERFLKKLKDKKIIAKFKTVLDSISNNPYIGTLKQGDLAGIYGYDLYYNKTNYEIAYRIYEEDGKYVIVILAGTRENFYDELKRYMK